MFNVSFCYVKRTKIWILFWILTGYCKTRCIHMSSQFHFVMKVCVKTKFLFFQVFFLFLQGWPFARTRPDSGHRWSAFRHLTPGGDSNSTECAGTCGAHHCSRLSVTTVRACTACQWACSGFCSKCSSRGPVRNGGKYQIMPRLKSS